jgi:hypothetical protein
MSNADREKAWEALESEAGWTLPIDSRVAFDRGWDAGREFEGSRRDEHDAALSEAGDTPWDEAASRSICYALDAWGGRCSKPGGHRGIHVADGGTGRAWGWRQMKASAALEGRIVPSDYVRSDAVERFLSGPESQDVGADSTCSAAPVAPVWATTAPASRWSAWTSRRSPTTRSSSSSATRSTSSPTHWREFDAIHASPPCQASTALTKGTNKGREYVQLIPETRRLLRATGLPRHRERAGLRPPPRPDAVRRDVRARRHPAPLLRGVGASHPAAHVPTAAGSAAGGTAPTTTAPTSPSTATAAARARSPSGRPLWASTGPTTARPSPRPSRRPTPTTSE